MDPVLLDLTKLINLTYTDKIDEILDYRLTDAGWAVLARDGIKNLFIKITDEEILIRVLNAADLDPGAPDELEEEPTMFAAEPNPVEQMLAQVVEQGRPQWLEWTDRLQDLLEESPDLMAFQERLEQIYPDLQAENLVEVMAEAMFAAELLGIQEAEDA